MNRLAEIVVTEKGLLGSAAPENLGEQKQLRPD
jgi:hypothetical protein